MKKVLDIISFPFFIALILIFFIILKEIFNINYLVIFFFISFLTIITTIIIVIFKKFFIFITYPFFSLITILFTLRIEYLTQQYLNANNNILDNEKFIGYVADYPVYKNSQISVKLRVIAIKKYDTTDYVKIKKFNILLKIETNNRKLIQYGDHFVINKKISFAQERIGNFYYKKFLYYHQIYGICKIKENDLIKLNNIKLNFFIKIFKNSIYKIREYIIENILYYLNQKSSSFVLSIFLGLRNEIDEETLKNFENSGLLHLLAISGLHIGFIGVIFFSFFNLFLSKSKSYIFSMIFLLFYILMLVPQPSSQRAFIMYCITNICFILGRKSSGITILSFSCIFLLFFNPYSIFDIGFQLSFMATLGILLFSKSIEEKLPLFIPKKIKGIISVTISAFFSIFLLQWALFGKIAFFSLVSSIVMIPLFEFLFIILFIFILIILIFKIKFIALFINFLCETYLKIVEILEIIPFVRMIKIPIFISYLSIPIFFIIFYILIPLILKKIKSKQLLN